MSVVSWTEFNDDVLEGRLRIDTGEGVVSVMFERDDVMPQVYFDREMIAHLPEHIAKRYELEQPLTKEILEP